MAAFAFLLIASAAWLYFQPQTSASAGTITTDTGEGGSAITDALAPAQDAIMSIGSTMRTSDAGISAIAAREGFAQFPYRDARGWSVGYGHFIKPGEDFSAGVTQDQAMQLLSQDVGSAENAVNAQVSVPLTQSQFDALVSFVYNVGAGAFASSTLLQKLNAGDYAGADAEFQRWVYEHQPDGTKIQSPALMARRASEAQQFLA